MTSKVLSLRQHQSWSAVPWRAEAAWVGLHWLHRWLASAVVLVIALGGTQRAPFKMIE